LTLERRRGEKIEALGVYRDAARSSKQYCNKASGLRWMSLMLLSHIPFAGRVWALPVFTVLAPSERYDQQRGRSHKTLAERARLVLLQLRRWLPKRDLVVVADGEYSVLELLAAVATMTAPVTLVTRLRVRARLFEPATARQPGTIGRPACTGKRLPKLSAVSEDPETVWQRMTVPRWYSQGEREIEIVTGTGVWYHPGKPVVALRYVLIRDPKGPVSPPSAALHATGSHPRADRGVVRAAVAVGNHL
jgi:hypothetical protein